MSKRKVTNKHVACEGKKHDFGLHIKSRKLGKRNIAATTQNFSHKTRQKGRRKTSRSKT